MVATPGAREAATCGNRRHHLAGLGILRDHDPLERRTDLEVGQALPAQCHATLCHTDIGLRRCEARGERSDFGLGGVEHTLRDELALDEAAIARERAA